MLSLLIFSDLPSLPNIPTFYIEPGNPPYSDDSTYWETTGSDTFKYLWERSEQPLNQPIDPCRRVQSREITCPFGSAEETRAARRLLYWWL